MNLDDPLPGRIASTPNYFWFVTYLFEIEPPAYAGWILVEPVTFDSKYPDGVPHALVTKKRAPRLHPLKWDDAKIAKIARLLSYRLLKEFERDLIRMRR